VAASRSCRLALRLSFADPNNPPAIVWGDPLPGGKVCLDELRADATHGAWRCISSIELSTDPTTPEVARKAYGWNRPCTHRRVEGGGSSWRCLTTVRPSPYVLRPVHVQQNDPVFFADLTMTRQTTSPPDGSLCTEEMRRLPNRGTWRCTTWQQLTTPFRLVQVIEPHIPCTFRFVDEFTGVWSCLSAKPLGRSSLH